jgi:hypothetical protein
MTLERFAIGPGDVYSTAGLVTVPAARPERVRAVQVRLVTRGTEIDREVGLAPPSGGGLFRFWLTGRKDADDNPLDFVRVRSLGADVALPNQAGVTW